MHVAVLDPSLFTLAYDRHLCRALAGHGHKVSLWGRPLRPGESSGHPGDGEEGFERLEFHFRRLETPGGRALPQPLRLLAKGGEHLVDWARLPRALAARAPDIIHLQWLPLPLVDRWFLGQLRALAPLVVTVHDGRPFHGSPAASIQAHGWWKALQEADLLLVHTEATRAALRQHLGDSVPIARVGHGPLWVGTEPPTGGEQRQKTARAEDTSRLRLLFFGTLKPYKGLDVLLEALGGLGPAQRDRVSLCVAGPSCMDLAPLEQRIKALELEASLQWRPGFVDATEIPALFAANDVLVLPYRESDASGVLSLALSYGLPVAASRVGGLAEALDGGGGLLVEPDGPEPWTQAIARLLGEADLLDRLTSEMASLRLRWPSWEAIAERTSSLYSEAAGLRSNAVRRSDRA